ncbi:MAG: NADH-quinone oxidoreductase subunit N [Bacteroidetes bacterium]|nr:NADH-quinone oxidoreductase subunit N [Bacteroidota bacterium]
MKALILLFVSGIFAMFGGIFNLKKILPLFSVAALLTVLGYLIYDQNYGPENLGNMLIFDSFSFKFTAIAVIGGILISWHSASGFAYKIDSKGDLLALMFFVLCGLTCMVSYNNLLMLFLGIEILSIPLYVLAGSNVHSAKSNEASLKYFIMGAFATGFLLLGITLIYGATHSFNLNEIRSMSETAINNFPGLLNTGLILIAVSFAFKIAAVPFHVWSPDVYEGSPTIVTAIMATIVKIGAIGAFLRLTIFLAPMLNYNWYFILAIISALTIITANFIAILQTDFKRMMAYSSISHVGYILLALLNPNTETTSTVAFYLISYTLATIGIFSILMIINKQHNETNQFSIFNGLSKKTPFLGLLLSVFLLSLAGIPPLPGFFAKYAIFKQAVDTHLWLVIIAICGSAISIFYYFKAISVMFFADNNYSTETNTEKNYLGYFALIITFILLAAISVFPSYFFNF